MSFDEVSYPLKASLGASSGVSFSTDVTLLTSGYEVRNQNWERARRIYNVGEHIGSVADAALLSSFFCARRGRAHGFRLKDWLDFTSAQDGISVPAAEDQMIGQGDGHTTQFQLVKTYGVGNGALARSILKPLATGCLVALDGSLQEEGWSVETTTGLVTFAVAPSLGVAVSAGFYFDVPVRFDVDRIDIVSLDQSRVKFVAPLVELKNI